MIGSGLKKYAQQNGLKVTKGVAYGNFRGYAATMSEGANYKQIVLSTKFTQAGDADALLAELNATNIQRLYRVQSLNIAPNGISIVFLDTVGTLKKITAFVDWFIPLLDKYSATAWNVCGECGEEIASGRWVLIDGTAHYFHDACFDKLKTEITEEELTQKAQDDDSYAAGATGAFLGALLGAVVWGFVLCMGYVASIVGLLIGWLANKGYDLLKGRKGKGKIVILALAVIAGVVIGTLGGYAVGIWMNTNDILKQSGMDPLSASYLFDIFIDMLATDEIVGYIIKDILLGLLFAALGVFTMLKRTSDEVSDTKIAVLE